MAENTENYNGSKKKKAARRIAIIILLLIFICSAVYIGYYIYNQKSAENEYDNLTTTRKPSVSENLVDNPIDFESLTSQNDEIYAWIKIEDTNVDYPIVQSNSSDSFYLKHSALDKSWLASGAIYTEGCNTRSFYDAVTVVYGHNGYSDTMFTTLHNFEKEEFFNSHEYFYVYLQGRRLTYQVVSAFKYDDRHIMNSFDFNDPEQLQMFQETVTNPNSLVQNVRAELDVDIDENSKLIVLSTCIKGQKSNRYLVCGVLVKDEKTN